MDDDYRPAGPALFQQLAREHPDQLLAYVQSRVVSDGLRARAVLAIAGFSDHDDARRALLPLLSLGTPIVKEAACHALGAHLDDEVRRRLGQVADDDRQPAAVRAAAREELEDLIACTESGS